MGKKADAKKSAKKGDKKGDKKGAKKGDHNHCGSCKNFDASKKGGWCRNHKKERSADDKVCGHYDPR